MIIKDRRKVRDDPIVNLSRGRVVSVYSKALPAVLVITAPHSHTLSSTFLSKQVSFLNGSVWRM